MEMGKSALILRMVVAVPLLSAALAVAAPAPAAAAFACTTEIIGGTIKENVVVPAGQTCTMRGVTVRGGVTIGAGATYFGRDRSEIRGPITGADIGVLQIFDGVVRGSVTIAGAAYVSFGSFAAPMEVRGDVAVSGATGYAEFRAVTIRGGATFENNAEVRILENSIRTDLACYGNGSADNLGSPNIVGGATLGQCAGL
jgi:hypothetical protein